jgi:hypothetical protein
MRPRKSGSHKTRRWREPDSNHRSLSRADRVSRVENGGNRRESVNLMGARPLLSHAELGADLGNRGYRRDSHQCSDQRIFDCGETGTIIDEIL